MPEIALICFVILALVSALYSALGRLGFLLVLIGLLILDKSIPTSDKEVYAFAVIMIAGAHLATVVYSKDMLFYTIVGIIISLVGVLVLGSGHEFTIIHTACFTISGAILIFLDISIAKLKKPVYGQDKNQLKTPWA